MAGIITGDDSPGFFLKVQTKNVPRVKLLNDFGKCFYKIFLQLGKRNNFFIKQGSKNIPRIGRRSSLSPNPVEELKYYNHVQPFDSKFMLDFLSDELFVGNGDLKFVSWADFDKALASDTQLKMKLTSIARDKEIDELKKLVYATSDGNNESEVYGRPVMYNDPTTQKIYQKFIPYDASDNFKYNNVENDAYFYHNNNEVKRGATQEAV